MKQGVILLICTVLLVSGCAWVELTPGGEKVRILSESEVASCKKLGNTSVNVADKVAGMQRQPHIIADNLQTLARNAAAEMHGDTIVPDSPVEEGRQKFNVYRCIGP